MAYKTKEYEGGSAKNKITKETMEMIPMGVCVHCKSLLYLGMTNCSKCGAPVGESIDLEELQERVQELLRPETEIVYKEVPVSSIWAEKTHYGATSEPMGPMLFSSDEGSSPIQIIYGST